jgi:group I intron endonuclease
MNDEWKTWKFSGIYAITHIGDNKVYVGQSISIARRITQHKRTNGQCKHLYNAIRLYGWDAFEIKVLECVENPLLLDEREAYWIDLLDTYDPEKGYNVWPVTKVHKHVIHHTDETKQKLSLINRNPSAETRAKIALANHNRSEESKAGMREKLRNYHPSAETRAKIGLAWLGRKHTDEERAKISAAHKGKKHTPEHTKRQAAARRGKLFSEESKAKMRLAAKTRPPVSDATKAKIKALKSNISVETRAKMSEGNRRRAIRNRQNYLSQTYQFDFSADTTL